MILFFAVLSVLTVVVFFINIPFFIRHTKRAKVNPEIELYFIRGKFTYWNVLRQISLIESEHGKTLDKERRTISKWYHFCQKKKRPFKGVEKKVHRLLKK